MTNDRSAYSFELHFLHALKDILSFEDAQTLIFGDSDIKEGPRIEIGFSVSSVDRVQRSKIDNGSRQYLRRYTGAITVQVFTQCDPATHFFLVGSCRAKMGYLFPELIAPRLPLFQVNGLYEGASANGLSSDRDTEISTLLNFAIEWQIPKSAFADRDPYLIYNGMKLTYNGIPLTYNFEPVTKP